MLIFFLIKQTRVQLQLTPLVGSDQLVFVSPQDSTALKEWRGPPLVPKNPSPSSPHPFLLRCSWNRRWRPSPLLFRRPGCYWDCHVASPVTFPTTLRRVLSLARSMSTWFPTPMTMLVGWRRSINTTSEPITPLGYKTYSLILFFQFIVFFHQNVLSSHLLFDCGPHQGACVQNVLDSLIPALLADENRKFVYVEMARLLFLLHFPIWGLFVWLAWKRKKWSKKKK